MVPSTFKCLIHSYCSVHKYKLYISASQNHNYLKVKLETNGRAFECEGDSGRIVGGGRQIKAYWCTGRPWSSDVVIYPSAGSLRICEVKVYGRNDSGGMSKFFVLDTIPGIHVPASHVVDSTMWTYQTFRL